MFPALNKLPTRFKRYLPQKRMHFLFLAGSLYNFANELLGLHQIIFFTRLDWRLGLIFVSIMNILSAFLMPLLIYIYRHQSICVTRNVFLALGIVPLLVLPYGFATHNPYAQAVGLAVIQAIFWTLLHGLISRRTSEQRRAYQLSYYYNAMNGCKIFAMFVAGAFYNYLSNMMLAVIGMFCLCIAVWQMLPRFLHQRKFIGAENKASSFKISEEKTLFSLTTLQSALVFITTYLSPVWLVLMGFSAMKIGLMPVIILCLTSLLSPLMNRLTHHNKGHDVFISGLGFTFYFLPWLFFSSPYLMYATQTVRAMAAQFMDIGISYRWYARNPLQGIAWREVANGCGRLLAACFIAPLLWLDIKVFIILGTLLSIGLCAQIYFVQKKKNPA